MAETNISVKPVYDYVCELPLYKELDYEGQAYLYEHEFKNLQGGCSATVKSIDGETIVARNLDFNISNKSAYIIKTEVPGFYKTVGVSYVPWFGPDWKEAVEEGVSEEFAKIIPFFSCDILNEKGFYIQADMRTEEHHDGVPRYKNNGLNPGGERVSSIAFLRYAAERCATVDDVLELLKEIDFYSLAAPGIAWGFAYIVADATGNYGVLEIAGDKVYFNKYQPVHTNMYVTPELAKDQLYRTGLGRYYTLMANHFKAKDEQAMQDLIDLVRYSRQYEDPETCPFDWRHEYYDEKDGVVYEKVIDPANQAQLIASQQAECARQKKMTRQEKQDLNSIWETTLSVRTNVMKRTMRIRFYEDENRVVTLTI